MVKSAPTEDKPLVSVNIPTYNSAKTLSLTLESVANQTFKNFETIIIDSNSTDNSREIAQDFGACVVLYDGKLLGARYIGVKESQGEYILLLDSDQILQETAIERACEMMEGNDYGMLVFEEHSYEPKTWVQRKLQAQRKASHASANGLDPQWRGRGGLLARFYRRGLLEKAFERIPRDLLPIVAAHDHAIIHQEAYNLSSRVGILTNAVWHIEPASLFELAKKSYKWGKTTKPLAKTGYYKEILRRASLNPAHIKPAVQSQTFLLGAVQGIAYRIGYHFG